jgi:hypothetical protein
VEDARKQGVEIELADDELFLGARARVDERQALLSAPGGEVPAEAAHVGFDVAGRFFEGDEHAVLAKDGDAMRQELRREHRLSAAGRAADDGRPAAREPAHHQLVEGLDPGLHAFEHAWQDFIVPVGHKRSPFARCRGSPTPSAYR